MKSGQVKTLLRTPQRVPRHLANKVAVALIQRGLYL